MQYSTRRATVSCSGFFLPRFPSSIFTPFSLLYCTHSPDNITWMVEKMQAKSEACLEVQSSSKIFSWIFQTRNPEFLFLTMLRSASRGTICPVFPYSQSGNPNFCSKITSLTSCASILPRAPQLYPDFPTSQIGQSKKL